MAMRKPIITIITSVFNGEKYIAETIDSVLSAAKNIDFEYLIINDGSTDSTPEILSTYLPKIKVINKSNSGESESVTKGFQEAQGEFVMVLSADDPLFTSEIFEEVFNWFENNSNLVAVYPDWRMIGPAGEVIKIIKVDDYSDELLIGECKTLPGPGVIIRKSAALKIGGRRKKWVFVGDYDFWLRLSRVGEIRHRSNVLSQWRMHPDSTSINRRGLKMAQERIAVVEEFLHENKIDPKLQKKALGSAYYMAARLIFFDRKVPAKKYLFLAFKYRGGWIKDAKIIVILYILLHPLGYYAFKVAKKFVPIPVPLS